MKKRGDRYGYPCSCLIFGEYHSCFLYLEWEFTLLFRIELETTIDGALAKNPPSIPVWHVCYFSNLFIHLAIVLSIQSGLFPKPWPLMVSRQYFPLCRNFITGLFLFKKE